MTLRKSKVIQVTVAQSVARVTGTLQFAGSIPAALLTFAQESRHVEHTCSVHAFEIIIEKLSGKAKSFKSQWRNR